MELPREVIGKRTAYFGAISAHAAGIYSGSETFRMTPDRRSCDSIKWRLNPASDWLYVLLRQSAVQLPEAQGEIPYVPTPTAALTEMRAIKWLSYISISTAPWREAPISQIHPNHFVAFDSVDCGNYIVLSYSLTTDVAGAITHVALEHFDERQNKPFHHDREGNDTCKF
jgi:hypothetical protein